jgi:hypothetical protein
MWGQRKRGVEDLGLIAKRMELPSTVMENLNMGHCQF